MRAAAWDGGGLIWLQSKQQREKTPCSYSFPWSKALRPCGGGRAGRDGTGRWQINCVFFAGCEVFAEAAALRQQEALPVAVFPLAVVSSETMPSRSGVTKLVVLDSTKKNQGCVPNLGSASFEECI